MVVTGELKVGGQAVVEGVMMRTPKSFAVAVRRANGQIVLRESTWRSLWERYRVLRWPLIRGGVILLESLVNGISALNFSARIAMEDEEAKKGEATAEAAQPEGAAAETQQPAATLQVKEVSDWVIGATVVFALGVGVALFIALPHLAVWLGSRLSGRELGVADIWFHVIAGGAKLVVFLGYIALISTMKDVRRVFMYHGAEHQSIYALEAGEPLTVESARKHKPLHPRCGTTFLIMVIAASILVFALVFPLIAWLIGEPTGLKFLDQIIYIGIKLPLLFPIAGVAYELQRLTSRHIDSWWARLIAWPGLAVQRMTTRRPTDDQLEVALTSLRKTLWREKAGSNEPAGAGITVFADFEAVMQQIPEVG